MLSDQDIVSKLQNTYWRPRWGFFDQEGNNPCALMQIAGIRCRNELLVDGIYHLSTTFYKMKTGRSISYTNYTNLEHRILIAYDTCTSHDSWEARKANFAEEFGLIKETNLLKEVA